LERNQHGPPKSEIKILKMKKSFIFYYIFFILFVFILLVQGIYSAYYYKISAIIEFLPFKSVSSINPYIWNENGLVEILQNFFLLFSVLFVFRFLKNNKLKRMGNFLFFFIYLYFIGLIYYFFEEISWGQHIFFWNSPEFFSQHNNQNETNFHNTSNLLNELPRSLLLIWCTSSFLFINLFNKKNHFSSLKIFIFPNKNLKKISLLLLFFVLPDLIVDKLNLHPGYPIDWITEIRLYEVIDFITFNYLRLSELHELIFDYYILSHSYYLIKLNQFDDKS
tara:strand:+ start:509 stop:1345 length:837 start_codon:yes stop_codon:yes gene_type:complete